MTIGDVVPDIDLPTLDQRADLPQTYGFEFYTPSNCLPESMKKTTISMLFLLWEAYGFVEIRQLVLHSQVFLISTSPSACSGRSSIRGGVAKDEGKKKTAPREAFFGQGLGETGGPWDGDNTVAFLDQLLLWLGDDPSNTLIICAWKATGVSYHSRCAQVQQHAEKLDFSCLSLPAYSPDLNPIEGLWKWMREDLSQHHSFKYFYQLQFACREFIECINLDPLAIISRLWPRFSLDPAYEKLLVSN